MKYLKGFASFGIRGKAVHDRDAARQFFKRFVTEHGLHLDLVKLLMHLITVVHDLVVGLLNVLRIFIGLEFYMFKGFL